MPNRLAAASARSPAGLRFITAAARSVPGMRSGPKASNASPVWTRWRRAAPPREARSARRDARRDGRVRDERLSVFDGATGRRHDRLARHPAGAQQDQPVALHLQDGRLDPDGTGAAVHHRVDPSLEIRHDVRRRGGADVSRSVRARRGDRASRKREDPACQGMGGHADRQRVEPGRGEIAHAAPRAARQNEGQRTRPEGGGETARQRVEARERLRRREVRHVGDQGVEARSPLGRIDACDGSPAGGVGAQPVDRLRGKGDEPALRQNAPGLVRSASSAARRRVSGIGPCC